MWEKNTGGEGEGLGRQMWGGRQKEGVGGDAGMGGRCDSSDCVSAEELIVLNR